MFPDLNHILYCSIISEKLRFAPTPAIHMNCIFFNKNPDCEITRISKTCKMVSAVSLKLPRVIKTEFLLTISIQYQADK